MVQAAPSTQPTRPAAAGPGAATSAIQVVMVDDSAVIRGLVKRWIDETDGLEIAGSCSNGKQAIDVASRVKPHVMILDIEMPEMDGLEALPGILKASPGTKVIMASTLTLRNADISLKALSLGATDYVPKPDSARGIAGSNEFRRELLVKVRALGTTARRAMHGSAPLPTQRAAASAAPAAAVAPAAQQIALRKPSTVPPRILAIGSSTGGPQALFDVFEKTGASLKAVPVVITQHMPPSFTKILAEKLGKLSGLPAKEGEHGERLQAGHIYVAPGDYHMRLKKDGPSVAIALDQEPPVHFCRPAVDPMFESVAAIFGAASLGVVLTGMGHDGRDGGRIIADAGGTIYAQDEATSVVWGMPGACAQAGICSGVYPLEKICSTITRQFGGR
ncbi:protein-glutamate methylesterase/protein-glutamine glutaminase [Pyruvatibacter mobilis]|uniref:protein-glutamate methylesterase/protein-glutamine glutaminase n=1 Tax=Pyruvatibacter mobilis TaxID=1712261 RepID=UPI003BAA5E34